MDTIRCTCGAEYRVKPELAGKRVRCKHCQNKITFPLPEITPAVDGDNFDWTALADGRAVAPASVVTGEAAVARAVVVEEDEQPRHRVPDYERGSLAAYLKDCAWSFAFVAEPNNIVSFTIVAVFYALAIFTQFAPCIGLFAVLLVYAWYCGYLFQILEGSASGERELPNLNPEGDWLEGIVFPILRFVAVSILAFGPAVAATAWRWQVINATGTILGDPVILSVLIAGVFFYPIFMLVVALGGIGCLGRIDLMIRTIVQTFPAYVLTVLAVVGAGAANYFSNAGLQLKMGTGSMTDNLALVLAGRIVSLYFMIVSMKVIGLYYHHFKSRFAWSWG